MSPDESSKSRYTVEIEHVDVVRDEGSPDPAVRRGIERLLARWLVRAYIREYGNEVPGESDAERQKGEEVQ